jgi:spore germination cell wall hydrolase CwlJ-like protein
MTPHRQIETAARRHNSDLGTPGGSNFANAKLPRPVLRPASQRPYGYRGRSSQNGRVNVTWPDACGATAMAQGNILLLIAALAAHGQHVKTEHAEKSCLAQALYYEARGESERGKEAVAEVILHRVRSGAHPKSVCGVVYEPHQFSFLEDGSTRKKVDANAWKDANRLASKILHGDLVTSLTRNAMFYHSVDVLPDWTAKMVRTAQIGRHIFYQRPRPPAPRFKSA